MGQELSGTQTFKAVAYGVVGLFQVFFGIVLLSNGAGLRGVGCVCTAVSLAYLSYRAATSPPAPPESQDDYKKCAACGKFTRKAAVCRHCGHDLTHSVSGGPPKRATEKLPTDSGDPAAEAREKSTTVRCKYCGHVQVAPVSQETFLCEHCKAHLKRRTAPTKSN
jgi:hypothetical protein